jgi:hypothetical protein
MSVRQRQKVQALLHADELSLDDGQTNDELTTPAASVREAHMTWSDEKWGCVTTGGPLAPASVDYN